jgi:hypothetical protein
MSLPKVKEFVRSKGPTETVGSDDMRKLLIEHTGKEPDERTIRNYTAVALNYCESTTDSAVHKTEARLTAENSLIAAMTHALCVCSALILPGPRPVGIRCDAEKNNLALKLMENTFGVEHHFVNRAMIFSTDDTALPVHTGTVLSSNCSKTRGVPHASGTATHAVCQKGNEPPSTYVNCHLTTTTSGAGFLAPLVLRVRVTERELQSVECRDGFYVLEVEGLSPGGDVDPTCTRPGYIVFIRTTGDKYCKSAEQSFFRWYHRAIRLPFIRHVRNKVFDLPSDSELVEEGMEAANWVSPAG